MASVSTWGLLAGVGEGGGEEAVGPLLGEGPGLAEDDGDGGEAGLALAERVGDDGGADAVELEDGGVSVLDDDGRGGE
ncbi:hypothetical protein BJF82_14370 [Kytococcus sp. CUA-901]|nr:hypothetical protein BJF82_14370 [Kytococcus sp. CUA-901]